MGTTGGKRYFSRLVALTLHDNQYLTTKRLSCVGWKWREVRRISVVCGDYPAWSGDGKLNAVGGGWHRIAVLVYDIHGNKR